MITLILAFGEHLPSGSKAYYSTWSHLARNRVTTMTPGKARRIPIECDTHLNRAKALTHWKARRITQEARPMLMKECEHSEAFWPRQART